MSGLLLGTFALRKFIAGDRTLHDWLDLRPGDVVHATVVSVGVVLAQAEGISNVSRRRLWIERLTEGIPADFGPRLHSFDLQAAKQWSAVRASLAFDLPQLAEADLSVIAIALDRRLEYVAPQEAWFGLISGLKGHDPWASTSFPT